ncbi:hypothetical protein [Deinococcus puniceus]|uniref:DUF3298 domain-containing protein n=1 Tax=Deinococcus puniceus TaxID=1182568 RepID=A0A172TB08_9DEIO|nr:hypothetical protein [Deinococcus puniceus]ANE44126.1 hypothetical protein SU48_10480 [Deinococcus puniceus]
MKLLPMKRCRSLAFLLCAGLASGAAAQDADLQECGGVAGAPAWAAATIKAGAIYRGTVGTLPVVLQLGAGADGVGGEARYYYERRGVNIELTPFRSGQSLILQEEVWSGPMNGRLVTGCLTLNRNGVGFTGTWAKANGSGKLPVRLSTLNVMGMPLKLPTSPGLLKLRTADPLAFLKLNRAWAAQAGGKTVREPLSGVVYPRVAGASLALSAALQDQQLGHAVSALDCKSMLGSSDMAEGYDLNAAITYTSAKLVSLREDAGYYCGGAHPDNFTVGVILDRATGRAVPLSAIWPKLTDARQKALYLANLPAEVDTECRDVLRERGSEFTFHLTPAGLNLTPTSLPHVVGACAETAVLPFASLKAEANAQGAYYREFYR